MSHSKHTFWARGRTVLVAVLVALVVGLLPPASSALATLTVPVTVTITSVRQYPIAGNFYDSIQYTELHRYPDFFAQVFIDSTTPQVGPRIDNRPAISPGWTFKKDVPKQQGSIIVRIEIWDYNGSLWPSMIVDVDPRQSANCDLLLGCHNATISRQPRRGPPADDRGVDLVLDLSNGTLSGDATSHPTCLHGDDADLCFDITVGNQSTITVTKTDDTNDGECFTDCSLREAISVAQSGDTIIVPAGIYVLTYSDPIAPGHLLITQWDLTIAGPENGGRAIVHQGLPGVRVFEIGGKVHISNMTIRGGTAGANSQVAPTHNHGGGIHNHGHVQLTNVTLTDNDAPSTDPAFGGGGAIANALYSTMKLLNVTITNNRAAAPKNGGGIIDSGGMELANTIVANNISLDQGVSTSSNCAGAAVISRGHNISSDATCAFNASGDFINTDPLLRFDGGIFVPWPGSRAIDRGNNSSCPSRDQIGAVRPLDGDNNGTEVCDIGAIEVVPDDIGSIQKPLDSSTNTAPATLTFDTIITPGTSSLVIGTNGSPAPVGFLPSNPAMYYDLATTAEFSGPVQVCIAYEAAAFTREPSLRLFRFAGSWVDVTESLDAASHTICGRDSALSTFAIFQQNLAPTVDTIGGPAAPVPLGTPFSVSAGLSDADGLLDSHAAMWDWGDGSTSSGIAYTPGSAITGDHTYSAPGSYTIRLTVRDSAGAIVQERFRYVVVYDPGGAFSVGGGWIDSPAGAYAPAPSFTGRASFGFVAQRNGADASSSQPQLGFAVADLSFSSAAYECRVLSPASAQCVGTGRSDSSDSVAFLLTVVDGEASGDGIDRLRLQIWDQGSGKLIYDNQAGNSFEAAPIGAGSILIGQCYQC
jgi:CSLREA domain-containing protein